MIPKAPQRSLTGNINQYKSKAANPNDSKVMPPTVTAEASRLAKPRRPPPAATGNRTASGGTDLAEFELMADIRQKPAFELRRSVRHAKRHFVSSSCDRRPPQRGAHGIHSPIAQEADAGPEVGAAIGPTSLRPSTGPMETVLYAQRQRVAPKRMIFTVASHE